MREMSPVNRDWQTEISSRFHLDGSVWEFGQQQTEFTVELHRRLGHFGVFILNCMGFVQQDDIPLLLAQQYNLRIQQSISSKQYIIITCLLYHLLPITAAVM